MTVEKRDWTEAALAALIESGEANVKVERLARGLNVTKGSFYWHFSGRGELLREVAGCWVNRQREYAKALSAQSYEKPVDRLRALLQFVDNKDGTSDVAMRLWAKQVPWVDALVAEIDELRIAYCTEVFRDLGFGPRDAVLRGQQVYFRQVARQTISSKAAKTVQSEIDGRWFDWLIAGSPET